VELVNDDLEGAFDTFIEGYRVEEPSPKDAFAAGFLAAQASSKPEKGRRRWRLETAPYAYTDDTHWVGPPIAEGESVEVVEVSAMTNLGMGVQMPEAVA
jgi:hypothetical protein